MKLRDGSEPKDPRLGRVKQFDERSRRFDIGPRLGLLPFATKYWTVPFTLDQGQEPSCVGNAWAHEAMSGPVQVPDIDESLAYAIYKDAQDRDEWAGSDYEGTSTIGGAKAMVARGYYSGYHWAFNADDLCRGVGHEGPCVIGIDWLDNMFDPADDYFLDCTGSVAGGHALLVWGVQVKDGSPDYVLVHNSWGPSWGRYGNAKVRYGDLVKLLDGGDCCFPTGRRYP